MRSIRNILLVLFFSVGPCVAQDTDQDVSMPGQSASSQIGQNMPGMNETNAHKMGMDSHSLIQLLEQHATSGTDAEPNSTPFEMLMTTKAGWTLMFHGEAF